MHAVKRSVTELSYLALFCLLRLDSEAMVKLVFSAGAEALDADKQMRSIIGERVKKQLRFIQYGAIEMSKRN